MSGRKNRPGGIPAGPGPADALAGLITRAEQAAADLRQATREAHEAAQDIRQAARDAHAQAAADTGDFKAAGRLLLDGSKDLVVTRFTAALTTIEALTERFGKEAAEIYEAMAVFAGQDSAAELMAAIIGSAAARVTEEIMPVIRNHLAARGDPRAVMQALDRAGPAAWTTRGPGAPGQVTVTTDPALAPPGSVVLDMREGR